LAGQGALVELPAVASQAGGGQYDEAVKELRRLYLVTGGYDNDYRLGEPLTAQNYLNILFHGSVRMLNLQGFPDLAAKGYFVVADREGFVTRGDIDELNDLFYRLNPHLKTVVPPEKMAAIWSELLEGISAGQEIDRGVVYKGIARYLGIMRSYTGQ
jgi:hypothetical protein